MSGSERPARALNIGQAWIERATSTDSPDSPSVIGAPNSTPPMSVVRHQILHDMLDNPPPGVEWLHVARELMAEVDVRGAALEALRGVSQ